MIECALLLNTDAVIDTRILGKLESNSNCARGGGLSNALAGPLSKT